MKNIANIKENADTPKNIQQKKKYGEEIADILHGLFSSPTDMFQKDYLETNKDEIRNTLNKLGNIPTELYAITKKVPPIPTVQEIMEHIEDNLHNLNIEWKQYIENIVTEYVRKMHFVHDTLHNPKYETNPWILFAESEFSNEEILKQEFIHDMKENNLPITIIQKGAFATCYIPKDFKNTTIYKKYKDVFLGKSAGYITDKVLGEKSWFVVLYSSYNEEKETTQEKHEIQHGLNSYSFSKSKEREHEYKFFPRIKDEVIAYMTEKRLIHPIFLRHKINNYIDDYSNEDKYVQFRDEFLQQYENNPDKKKQAEKIFITHEKESRHLVSELLSTARKMRKRKIPNYMHILAMTPIENRKDLSVIYNL